MVTKKISILTWRIRSAKRRSYLLARTAAVMYRLAWILGLEDQPIFLRLCVYSRIFGLRLCYTATGGFEREAESLDSESEVQEMGLLSRAADPLQVTTSGDEQWYWEARSDRSLDLECPVAINKVEAEGDMLAAAADALGSFVYSSTNCTPEEIEVRVPIDPSPPPPPPPPNPPVTPPGPGGITASPTVQIPSVPTMGPSTGGDDDDYSMGMSKTAFWLFIAGIILCCCCLLLFLWVQRKKKREEEEKRQEEQVTPRPDMPQSVPSPSPMQASPSPSPMVEQPTRQEPMVDTPAAPARTGPTEPVSLPQDETPIADEQLPVPKPPPTTAVDPDIAQASGVEAPPPAPLPLMMSTSPDTVSGSPARLLTSPGAPTGIGRGRGRGRLRYASPGRDSSSPLRPTEIASPLTPQVGGQVQPQVSGHFYGVPPSTQLPGLGRGRGTQQVGSPPLPIRETGRSGSPMGTVTARGAL